MSSRRGSARVPLTEDEIKLIRDETRKYIEEHPDLDLTDGDNLTNIRNAVATATQLSAMSILKYMCEVVSEAAFPRRSRESSDSDELEELPRSSESHREVIHHHVITININITSNNNDTIRDAINQQLSYINFLPL